MKKYINDIIVIGFMLFAYLSFTKLYFLENDLPKLYKVPTFNFSMLDGSDYTDKNMQDKVSIVNFFYTSCPAICPAMMSKMNLLYERIDNKEVEFISFNVDPKVDSKDKIKKFAKQLNIFDKDRWNLIMTSSDEISTLCEEGFKFSADNLPYDHPMRIILVDKNLMIRGYYDYGSSEQMTKILNDIKRISGDYL